MGRQKNKYCQVTLKGGNLETDTDTDTCTSKRAQPVSKTLKQLLEQLYEKRGSTREAALSSIIQIFSFGYHHKFAEQNFTELLYQFLKAFKRSSTKESCLGVEALGLLAINIGCGENSQELYKELAPILSEALNTESNSKKLKLILDSLAVITFVGGNELEETERSMRSIWHFMHSRGNLKDAQSAAILSWSLLLSTMDSWSLNYKHWRGAIPFFKKLIEAEHEPTVVGARQALSLIYELGCLEKFEGDTSAPEEMNAETEVKENGHVLEISEGDTSAQEEMNVETVVKDLEDWVICEVDTSALEEMNVKTGVKENGHVLEISEVDTSAPGEMNVKTVAKDGHVPEISEGGTSAPEEVNVKTVVKDGYVTDISKCDTSAPEEMNVGTVVKDDHVTEISVKIGKQLLTVNTSPQQIQHNFLKRLLGSGFVVHMRENELLHDVFKFKPEKRKSGKELYVAERNEVGINLFVPDVIREENYHRIHNSQNSIFVKAKTQLRNKNRDIKEEQWCSED
ncbi:armadillo-type fold protein [Artemisia annua]|uniref:Armadillo-type fold protein n=1 Tax=Artemisia annua TaxID=35608 RepID=A0A2U1PBW9_ARTAN|nr:armadillo-type fold protein [Artemisia annua]